MSSERIRQLIEEATSALQSGKNAAALDLLDEAVNIAPDRADLYGLRGIGFAQTGRAEAATESFRKASMLDPSAKTFYNLAVHLYNIGDRVEALETIRESLKLDPNNVDAKQFVTSVAAQGDDPKFTAEGLSVAPTIQARKRRYGFGRKHLFGILAENQEPWLALGWVIVALSLISVVLVKMYFPLTAPSKVDVHNMLLGYKPIKTPFAFATIGFFVTMILASMIWTSLDLIDRRGRALWMVPMMICCFLWSPFVPQSLYMWMGRKDGN